MVTARAGWKPRSTSSTRTKLRIRRPAPTSSTQANAISETTSALRTQVRRASVEPRLASFSASCSAASGVVKRRRQAEDDAGHERHRERETERRRVDVTLASIGMLTASSRDKRTRPDEREASPSSAPLARQHQPFGEHLRDEPSAPGAERRADRNLLLTRRGAREQQVRQIGADDQHHDRHGAGEHRRRPARILPLT